MRWKKRERREKKRETERQRGEEKILISPSNISNDLMFFFRLYLLKAGLYLTVVSDQAYNL